MGEEMVNIEGRQVKLTNLKKPLWPEGLTKAHLVKYYLDMAPYILPHINNRPLVMKRYPDGLGGKPFYQKECPDYAPQWIVTCPVRHSEKTINYIVCNDTATLVWLANQGCIEVHAWLATTDNLECPDLAVMDLDPGQDSSMADTVQAALLTRRALEGMGLRGFLKTSGSRGLHILIPLRPVYPWKEVTSYMKLVAEAVAGVMPGKYTTERSLDKRAGRLYVDYLQNGRGKTMAFQYSLRPLPGAPVSTPLTWQEAEEGNIDIRLYNINTISTRLEMLGDIYQELLTLRQDIYKH